MSILSVLFIDHSGTEDSCQDRMGLLFILVLLCVGGMKGQKNLKKIYIVT